ncbi:MAG: hypothetical protein ACSLFQ_01515 [Thermoanaerobaculia bacterium]
MEKLLRKADQQIAEILAADGVFGACPRLEEKRALFMLAAKRTVCRDRAAIAAARRQKRRDLAGDYRSGDPLDYVFRMQSHLREAEEILEDPTSGPDARIAAIAEIRLIEQAIARVNGVAVGDEKEREHGNRT